MELILIILAPPHTNRFVYKMKTRQVHLDQRVTVRILQENATEFTIKNAFIKDPTFLGGRHHPEPQENTDTF